MIDSNEYQLPYAQANIKNYTLCKNGDVIFADASEDTKDICKPVEIININNQNIVSGLHTIHARDIKNITVLGFKGYLFSSLKFHKQISRLTQGTKIYSINQSNFNELYVGIPDKKEQTKIVDFLLKLDRRILTQNKIIKDLESQKKYILNLVFNFSKSNCTFQDLYVEAGEGGTPSTKQLENFENGNIPFIKIDDLSEKYLVKNKDFISKVGLENSSAWIIPQNSVIYSNGATIGRISINTYPVTTKQGILGIVPSNNVLTEYLYYFMHSNYFKRQVKKITTKGTMDCAYLKDLNTIKCFIPCIDQQLECVKYFAALDEKIQIEKRLLLSFKGQKRYFLKNIFI